MACATPFRVGNELGAEHDRAVDALRFATGIRRETFAEDARPFFRRTQGR